MIKTNSTSSSTEDDKFNKEYVHRDVVVDVDHVPEQRPTQKSVDDDTSATNHKTNVERLVLYVWDSHSPLPSSSLYSFR